MKIKPMSIIKVKDRKVDTYGLWGIVISVGSCGTTVPIDVWHPFQRGIDEIRKIGFFHNFTNFALRGMLMSYPRKSLEVLYNINRQRVKQK